MNKEEKKTSINTKFIARTAIFAALAIILYVVPILKFPLPFFPSFLEIHFDEVPIMIAGFAYGPLSAIFIIIVRTLVKLPFTTSVCVGELADLIYSTVFVIPATLIYRKIHKFKGAIIGVIVGSLCQIITACLVTTYLILDLYILVMPGLTKEAILAMCQEINPNISSLGLPFLFIVGLPFNAMKDAIVVVITILLYKRLHTLIDKLIKDKKSAQKN